ncbi:MAG: AMP-binding protein [Candidatus Aminicenantes bacterium]|nr:AMP-binding protein [Candidatus Aminicenantes bacterium]NIM80344.1 AMP-binding protein [Candidatus Aminicenantes bacterium]NIN19675.1 AMP-binding protein [Candidatus Aminicenantes bacterium]NIN43557.1 AMP-binding protein [Candidatus Aminicenantes bacterium]NIN86302.1 AMP-binding protein [Candidatus Aminicenantes bacterium]
MIVEIPPPGNRGNVTIHELFEAQVKKTPRNTAAVDVDGGKLSYEKLNEKANQLAWLLRSRGIRPGTVVGVLLKPSIEMLAVLLGIWKSGAACLPINPGISNSRLAAVLEEARVFLVVADSGLIMKKSFTAVQRLRLVDVDSAGLCITAPRPAIKDFDSMPMPDRTLVDYDKYAQHIGLALVKNSITMQATRGCPYKCAYCHKIWPKTHTARTAENIFSEVKHYYDLGIRRFSFIDDIFNLKIENSRRFFELVIKHGLNRDIHLLFPSGLRADLLSKDYIDLMVEAGTIHVGLAVETASPRLQKLIQKNMDIEKLREMAGYFCSTYPHVLLDLFSMLGLPSETEEEAYMTLDFIKNIKWAHFVFISLLKVFPNTDMEKIALEHGFSYDDILGSENLRFYQVSSGGQFDESFTFKYQANFLNHYFLKKERLLHGLPFQMRVLTEDEIIKKYDSFLPADIKTFDDLLHLGGITREELGTGGFLEEEKVRVPRLNQKIRNSFPIHHPDEDALRLLLLDVSMNFTDKEYHLYDLVEAPLGLMYLLTYIHNTYGSRVNGKIAKSKIDFDSYDELKLLLDDFKPHVIGIRSLSTYRDFFHGTVSAIRQFGITVPIVAGGPYATSTYKLLLQDPNIDLVVMGEGEITFGEVIGKMLENHYLLPGLEVLREIKGIVFRSHPPASTGSNVREVILWDQFSRQLSLQPTGNPPPLHSPIDLACVNVVQVDEGDRTWMQGIMMEHQTLLDYIARGYSWTDGKELDRIAVSFHRETKQGDWEAQEAFWKRELSGKIPVLNLTADFEPPARENRDGGKINFEIGPKETTALKQVARTWGTDLDILLLAVYNVLLFKLTRQEDIIVGCPSLDFHSN